MRKVFLFFIVCLFSVPVCFYCFKSEKPTGNSQTENFSQTVKNENESITANSVENEKHNEEKDNNEKSCAENSLPLKGVWLSYSEISRICKGKTEAQYTNEVRKITQTLSENSYNTVFFQVRAFSDAFYRSAYFPSSKYVVKNEGDTLDFDPLEIFTECAKTEKLSVHAWVNPFRVSFCDDVEKVSKRNPAKLFLNDKKNEDALILCEKGIYYNPSNSEVRKLILNGIKELFENYDIDGLQFDDYFYPPCEIKADGETYKDYRLKGGTLSLAEFRRETVSEFVSAVYATVKSYGTEKVFGISPSANNDYNENKIFADVSLWCCEDGYIDYILPQIYFGFKNETMGFTKVAENWCKIVKNKNVKLYCGLASYKCGKEDKNAGSGKNEWVVNKDILSKQYRFIEKNADFSGFSLFSYSFSFGENMNNNSKKEIKKLNDMIK